MHRLNIIVGAGGTGSYLLPNLLNKIRGEYPQGNSDKVVLIDGDFVEDRNLLRQGFLNTYLNEYKAKALIDMYKNMYPSIDLEYKTEFLNSANTLIKIVNDNVSENIEMEEVVLFSCVDNNYARLRMVIGQQLIKQYFPNLKVVFVDSGNEEWHGQSIVSVIESDKRGVIEFTNGKLSVVADTDQTEQFGNKLDTIFVRMTDWINKLDKGEHELSCDIVTESHPQNIATNMFASVVQVKAYSTERNINFNARKNKSEMYSTSTFESYLNSMQELVDFVNGDAEYTVLSKLFVMVKSTDNEESTTAAIDEEPVVSVVESVDVVLDDSDDELDLVDPMDVINSLSDSEYQEDLDLSSEQDVELEVVDSFESREDFKYLITGQETTTTNVSETVNTVEIDVQESIDNLEDLELEDYLLQFVRTA